MIFVSTGQIKNKTIFSIVKYYLQGGIKNIEMSGGKYDPDIIKRLISLKKNNNFMLHNYFPPPKNPFTLNLATFNKTFYKLGKNHVINAIRQSANIGSKYYSFHAGFLIDPLPENLGKKIFKQKVNDERIATELFLERLSSISKIAKKEGVELLVENNVLTKKNFQTFKKNPLMMTSLMQTLKIVRSFPKNVSLLIDLAHLKVSAKTLNFSPSEYLKKCDKWIKAYHLSDNKGYYDTNNLITKKSWFWPYISRRKKYYTLELRTSNLKNIKSQIKMLQKFLENKL